MAAAKALFRKGTLWIGKTVLLKPIGCCAVFTAWRMRLYWLRRKVSAGWKISRWKTDALFPGALQLAREGIEFPTHCAPCFRKKISGLLRIAHK